MINLSIFGDTHIFRPSADVETSIRWSAREHLLSRYPAGEYHGTKAANDIVQHQFRFYEKCLRPVVEQLPSRDTLDFLLSQYDDSARILHGNNISDPTQRESWSRIEPMFRRAIKYIAEMLCVESFSARKGLNGPKAVVALETAIVCAESMVHLAHESDLVHSIFPDDCTVSVRDKGPVYCNIAITGVHSGYDRAFEARIIRDRQSRGRFVPFPQFDNHTDTHARYLNTAFTQSFGMTYTEFIAAIVSVIDGAQPVPNGPSSLFIPRAGVLGQLAKSGRPRQGIERAIDGFSIAATKLLQEGRAIWNPKQEHRSYRRGFYVVPHQTGLHFSFSRSMARESLIQLVTWVPYKHLPTEWQTSATVSALANLSQAAGEWFERLICERLKAVGIIGQPFQRRIGNSRGGINIPASIGGIDFLGYCQKQRLVVFVEAKMVMSGLEARYWRDDIHEFVTASDSYAERFRKKRTWLKENLNYIATALGYGQPAGLATAMLTLYPCIARQLIPDFPCVSLTEFLLDYEQDSRWPYATD